MSKQDLTPEAQKLADELAATKFLGDGEEETKYGPVILKTKPGTPAGEDQEVEFTQYQEIGETTGENYEDSKRKTEEYLKEQAAE